MGMNPIVFQIALKFLMNGDVNYKSEIEFIEAHAPKSSCLMDALKFLANPEYNFNISQFTTTTFCEMLAAIWPVDLNTSEVIFIDITETTSTSNPTIKTTEYTTFPTIGEQVTQQINSYNNQLKHSI